MKKECEAANQPVSLQLKHLEPPQDNILPRSIFIPAWCNRPSQWLTQRYFFPKNATPCGTNVITPHQIDGELKQEHITPPCEHTRVGGDCMQEHERNYQR
jgi:hypothetical protein